MNKIALIMLTTIVLKFIICINFVFHSKKYTTFKEPRKDWCSPEVVRSCKTKCKLYKIFIRNPTNLLKQNYVLFRNRLSHIIIIAKQKYYFNLFNDYNIKNGLV